MDGPAIDAGTDLVKLLGRAEARKLLEILELPDDERWVFVSRMYSRDDGQALAELLADVEADLTGRTRERVVAGLHAALDRPIRVTLRVTVRLS